MSQQFESFAELAEAFSTSLPSSAATYKREPVRVDCETTDSMITSIMPCSFPNPEQILSQLEDALSARWDNMATHDITQYVERGANEPKFAYIRRVLLLEKAAFIAKELKAAYL